MPVNTENTNIFAQTVLASENYLALEAVLTQAVRHQFRQRETGWYRGLKSVFGYREKDPHVTNNSAAMVALARQLIEIGKAFENEVALLDLIQHYVARIIDGQLLSAEDIRSELDSEISEAEIDIKLKQEIIDAILLAINTRQEEYLESRKKHYDETITQTINDYNIALNQTSNKQPMISRILKKSRYTARYIKNTMTSEMGHFASQPFSEFVGIVNYFSLLDKAYLNEISTIVNTKNKEDCRLKSVKIADKIHEQFEDVQAKIKIARHNKDIAFANELFEFYCQPILDHGADKLVNNQDKDFIQLLDRENFQAMVMRYINGSNSQGETIESGLVNLDNRLYYNLSGLIRAQLKQLKKNADLNKAEIEGLKKVLAQTRFSRLKYDLRQLRKERFAENKSWNTQLKKIKIRINRWMRDELGLPSRIIHKTKSEIKANNRRHQVSGFELEEIHVAEALSYKNNSSEQFSLVLLAKKLKSTLVINSSKDTFKSGELAEIIAEVDYWITQLELKKIKSDDDKILEDTLNEFKEIKEDVQNSLTKEHEKLEQAKLDNETSQLAELIKPLSAEEKSQMYHAQCDYEVVNEDDPRLKYSATQQQQEKRKLKKGVATFNRVSLPAAAGEGIIAALGVVALGAVFPFMSFMTLPLAIAVIGVPGFICNYFLLKLNIKEVGGEFRFFEEKLVPVSTKDSLGNIHTEMQLKRVRKLWIDEKGNVASKTRQRIIKVVGIPLSVATGACMAVLSFMSTYNALAGIFTTLPAGAVGAVAVLPPIGVFFGLGAILFNVLNDFVKNKRGNDIKAFLKRVYIDHPWKTMSWSEIVFRKIPDLIYQTTLIVLALTLNALITVWSLGFFHDKGMQLATKFFNITSTAGLSFFNGLSWGASYLNAITWIPVHGGAIQDLVYMLFSAKGIAKLIANTLLTAGLIPLSPVLTIASAITQKNLFSRAYSALNDFISHRVFKGPTFSQVHYRLAKKFHKHVSASKQPEENSLAKVSNRSNWLMTIGVIGSVFLNALGQFAMVAACHASKEKLPTGLDWANGASQGFVSAGLNGQGAAGAIGGFDVKSSASLTNQTLEKDLGSKAVNPFARLFNSKPNDTTQLVVEDTSDTIELKEPTVHLSGRFQFSKPETKARLAKTAGLFSRSSSVSSFASNVSSSSAESDWSDWSTDDETSSLLTASLH